MPRFEPTDSLCRKKLRHQRYPNGPSLFKNPVVSPNLGLQRIPVSGESLAGCEYSLLFQIGHCRMKYVGDTHFTGIGQG